MRTQTLLIAAATALVAAVTSTQAQTVYSANVVGYVNVSVPNRVYTMVANQMDTGSNTLDNVFGTGPVSSATTALYWTGAGYHQYIFYNSDDSPDGGSGWYDASTQNPATTNTLAPGQGVFVFNTSGSTISSTFVGQVDQGTNTYTVPSGYSIWSVPQALAGLSLDNTNINFPAVSSSDTYLQWTGSNFHQLIYYNSDDSPDGGTGWYDAGTQAPEDGNAAVWPQAGQSFFIHHIGAPETWTDVFQVQ